MSKPTSMENLTLKAILKEHSKEMNPQEELESSITSKEKSHK